jgi:hypothetical protein
MIRTIVIGSCVSVQGLFVRALDNGSIVVSVGNRLFEGAPASQATPHG